MDKNDRGEYLVPQIGAVYSEDDIDTNFPDIKFNALKIVDAGKTNASGDKLYRLELK